MSWLDHQEKHTQVKTEETEQKDEIRVHMPGAPDGEFVLLGRDQIKRKYEDEIGSMLLIIVDEVAELLMPTKVKTEAGKAEDALKAEILMLIQSITQLGRSAGIHMVLCTQRNDASIIPGVIQNNALTLDTKLKVRRPL